MRAVSINRAIPALALLAGVAVAQADLVTVPLSSPINFTTTATNRNVNIPAMTSASSSNAIRGFFISGNWTGNGGAWSEETLVTFTGPGFNSGERNIGGVSDSNAFTYGLIGGTYEQNGSTVGIATETFNGPSAASPFVGTLAFRTGIIGGGSIANASATFVTDALAPVSGSITNATTFKRPNSLNTLAGGTNYIYTTSTFVAPATGTFLIGADYGTGFDGVLFLYNGAFNAASPLTNLIAMGDDGQTTQTSGIWINLTAGQTYTSVFSAFEAIENNGPTSGQYTMYVAGVPEPGTMLALGAGLAALAARRRRKA